MFEAMLSRSHAKKPRDDAGRTSERTALIAFAAAAAMLLLFYRGRFRTLLSCSADVCSTVILQVVRWLAGWLAPPCNRRHNQLEHSAPIARAAAAASAEGGKTEPP